MMTYNLLSLLARVVIISLRMKFIKRDNICEMEMKKFRFSLEEYKV